MLEDQGTVNSIITMQKKINKLINKTDASNLETTKRLSFDDGILAVLEGLSDCNDFNSFIDEWLESIKETWEDD